MSGEVDLEPHLRNYLRWVASSNRDIVLRGLRRRGARSATLPLLHTFVTLDAQPRDRRSVPPSATPPSVGLDLEPIDFSPLAPRAARPSIARPEGQHGPRIAAEAVLSLAPRAVLTGGAGCGKSSVLQFMALALAQSSLDPSDGTVRDRLGIAGDAPVPVQVPLNGFANFVRDRAGAVSARDLTFLRYAEEYLDQRQSYLDLPSGFFSRLMQQGRPLVLLLDGLDEIADEGQRLLVSRAIEDVSQAPFSISIVVTSRTSAYEGEVVLPPNFEEFEILPLSALQVRRTIWALCSALYPDDLECGNNARQLEDSVIALESQRADSEAGQARLITSPLMVRMLLTIHLSGRQVVRERHQLFDEYVEALLLSAYHPDARVASRLADVAGPLVVQRALLASLALHFHANPNSPGMTGAELRGFVVSSLSASVQRAPALEAADRFVDATRQRGGLLEEDGGRYRFSHLALQEYLAALQLADTLTSVDAFLSFVEADSRIASSWWREPILLSLGRLLEQDSGLGAALLRAMAHLDGPGSGDPLLELAELDTVSRACLEWRVDSRLKVELAQHIAARLFRDRLGEGASRLRATVGRSLGLLGDPRPGVSSPFPTMVVVTEGSIIMGHPASSPPVNLPSMQTGAYEVNVGSFAIGKFPVTNGQFELFVEASGYDDSGRQYWSDAGWAWKASQNVFAPAYWSEPTFAIPNHPVVGVSWYEAVAYCRWLTEQSGEAYGLPTEAEWEAGARGRDGRAWPWGDDPDSRNANTIESGIGTTSCVGLFPWADSPHGASECAGNVWEWCQSRFLGYDRYEPGGVREEEAGTYPRVLRGGSWLNDLTHARAANRDAYFPGDRHFDLGFRVRKGA